MAPLLHSRMRGLREPSVRLGWFSSWIATNPPELCAREIEALLDCSERFEAKPTPSLVTVVAWIGGAVAPGHLHAVTAASQELGMFRTTRLLGHAADCPVRLDETPHGAIPNYAPGRQLTLGERKQLARKPGRPAIEKLLLDPHPAVIEQLLTNPRLTETDLVRLVTLRPVHVTSICHLYRHGKWLTSHRVRLSLLLNPSVPLWQSAPLLSLCPRQHLKEVKDSQHTPCALQALAAAHLVRHPPLSSTAPRWIH